MPPRAAPIPSGWSRRLLPLSLVIGLVAAIVIILTTPNADAAPALQLPWPTGQAHYIWEGANGYNCGGHVGRDLYAIDFQLSTGNAVSAVAAGTAHRGSNPGGYGNFIWIDHGGGVVSLYGHLSSFAVADNVRVAQGQVVGAAGSSGNVTGPHLHFALRANATSWTNGTALLPEPMSGYSGFGQYGRCAGRHRSPTYRSSPPTTTTTTPPPTCPPNCPSDSTVTVRADFNGDGRSDVLLVTPRGPSGLNFVPLLSNGTNAFTHGGLWFNTGTDYTLNDVKLAAGDFNGDGRSDVLLVTPRGPSGLNFVPLLSNGTNAFTHGGLWFNTGTELTLDVLKLATGDFNGDSRSDVLLVTPRGPSGLNFVPLLSTGSAFVHGDLWFNTGTDYTLNEVRLTTGDFNGDSRSDVLLVTPRGPSGLNLVPLLSTGSAFTHGGLWFNTGTELTLDVLKLATGDFNGDGRSDVLLVTPRGPSGLNFVPLLSNGTNAFTHGDLWFNTGTDYTLDQIRLT